MSKMSLEFSKNEKVILEITDMTSEGLGVAKLYGRVFFVKNALVHDKVNAIITKVTDNIIYAKVIEIIEPSNYRIISDCKVSNKCGGCVLLDLKYEKQLELKKSGFINALTKIGKFDKKDLEDNKIVYDGIIYSDSPYYYRNKMQVPFADKNGEVTYGFYAGRTHYIVENDTCIVGFKCANEILKVVCAKIKSANITVYDENTGKGIFREVMLRKGNVSNEVSITYIINDANYKKNMIKYQKLDEEIRNDLAENKKIDIVTSTLNINTDNNNVLFGKENIIIYGKGYIEDSIGDIKYHISPESFYQINSEMTKKLYDKAVEYADFKNDETVLDLYCGIGTISLYIAKYVREVVGIEIVERAVKDAIENAKCNNINNANFKCMDADNINISTFNQKFDVVIVDPPRKGLDRKTIEFIKKVSPKKIIYVSCDPATLSRDLDIICHGENAYELKRIVNVDMFPHTMHVETVCLLSKCKL